MTVVTYCAAQEVERKKTYGYILVLYINFIIIKHSSLVIPFKITVK